MIAALSMSLPFCKYKILWLCLNRIQKSFSFILRIACSLVLTFPINNLFSNKFPLWGGKVHDLRAVTLDRSPRQERLWVAGNDAFLHSFFCCCCHWFLVKWLIIKIRVQPNIVSFSSRNISRIWTNLLAFLAVNEYPKTSTLRELHTRRNLNEIHLWMRYRRHVIEGKARLHRYVFSGAYSEIRVFVDIHQDFYCWEWTSSEVIRKIIKPLTEDARYRLVGLPCMKGHTSRANNLCLLCSSWYMGRSYSRPFRWRCRSGEMCLVGCVSFVNGHRIVLIWSLLPPLVIVNPSQ